MARASSSACGWSWTWAFPTSRCSPTSTAHSRSWSARPHARASMAARAAQVASMFHNRVLVKDEVLFSEGEQAEDGNSLYIIIMGAVEATSTGAPPRTGRATRAPPAACRMPPAPSLRRARTRRREPRDDVPRPIRLGCASTLTLARAADGRVATLAQVMCWAKSDCCSTSRARPRCARPCPPSAPSCCARTSCRCWRWTNRRSSMCGPRWRAVSARPPLRLGSCAQENMRVTTRRRVAMSFVRYKVPMWQGVPAERYDYLADISEVIEVRPPSSLPPLPLPPRRPSHAPTPSDLRGRSRVQRGRAGGRAVHGVLRRAPRHRREEAHAVRGRGLARALALPTQRGGGLRSYSGPLQLPGQVAEGPARVDTPDEHEIGRIFEGGYFGEMGLISPGAVRTSTVKTVKRCGPPARARAHDGRRSLTARVPQLHPDSDRGGGLRAVPGGCARRALLACCIRRTCLTVCPLSAQVPEAKEAFDVSRPSPLRA